MSKLQKIITQNNIASNLVLTSCGYQSIFNVITNKQILKIVAASKFDAIYITKKLFPDENIISLI